MKIQLNTDNNISGTENLERYVSEKLEGGLKHFANNITRLEVHLSDQNADKSGLYDIQCRIEARLKGLDPVSVLGKSDSKEKALDEAIKKMRAALSSIMGKIKDK